MSAFAPGAGRLAIHHPLGRVSLGQRQSGSGDGRRHLRAEHAGQGLVVEQVRPFAFAMPLGAPSPARAIHRRRRQQQMHMRVIVQAARIGMLRSVSWERSSAPAAVAH